MKKFNRRDFIRTSSFAISALGFTGLYASCGRNQDNIFKYCFCNEIIREFSWAEQCEIMAEAGYSGVEIAPFTLVNQGVQEISPNERRQMVSDMKNNGIECAGLHWLFTPPPDGLHFTTSDSQIRQKSVDYLSALIDFCADLGGEVMIFGSPNQRSTIEGVTIPEAVDYFADGLAQVADQAQQRNVKILVEPLSSDQTNVVNTLADAMEIVNKVNHPAISTMFDIHNTADESEPMDVLIREYFDHIHHVHVQNMDGTVIYHDQIPQEFISVFEELKALNYNKWISLEVFDYSPGGKTIAREGMKTFQEIERRIS